MKVDGKFYFICVNVICLTIQKPEISAGSMDHMACKGYSYAVYSVSCHWLQRMARMEMD